MPDATQQLFGTAIPVAVGGLVTISLLDMMFNKMNSNENKYKQVM